MRQQIEVLQDETTKEDTAATQTQKEDDSAADEEVEVGPSPKPEHFDDSPTRFGMYNMDQGHASILDKTEATALLQHQKQVDLAYGSDSQEEDHDMDAEEDEETSTEE